MIVSALYLFGLWGYFNINVLEFVSFADLAKLSAYPLVVSLITYILGTVFAEVLHRDQLSPGGGAQTKIGRFGRRHWRGMIVAHGLLVVAVATVPPYQERWFVVAFLVPIFSAPLTHLDMAFKLLPNPKTRSSVLYFLLLLPGLAFASGRVQASRIASGDGAVEVDVARSQLQLTASPQKPVLYVGLIGDYFVLYESADSSLVFVRVRDDAPIFLHPRSERKR